MIKVSELTGALLDYWTARAEGVPAEQLEIRQVPRTDKHHCVRVAQRADGGTTPVGALNYQDSPALWAPLIAKHNIGVHPAPVVGSLAAVDYDPLGMTWMDRGITPQEAICRAVVRAAFGNEVEEVPCK